MNTSNTMMPHSKLTPSLIQKRAICRLSNYDGYKKLVDNYDINFSMVKKGSYGQVITAIDKITKIKRAVKFLKKSRKNSDNTIEILREIEIMKRLDHPNLVNVIEYFEDNKYIYIVMEYIQDGELFDKIISQEYFSEKTAAGIMKQLLSAINYLHTNRIVHRDIKPENILLDGDMIKIIDFGASIVLPKKRKMQKLTGTSYYIAPEVIKGNYDEMCDIWSCGVIMYILLSGRPPFNGPSNNHILSAVLSGHFKYEYPEFDNVSLEARNLISQMLTYMPKERIRADEAVNHKWFGIIQNHQSEVINKALLKNLQSFNTNYRIQECLYRFFVKKILNSKVKNQIVESFKALDIDNNGILSKNEIIEGFRKVYNDLNYKEVAFIIDKMTLDNQPSINFTNFIIMVIDKRVLLSEDNIKKCFMLIDKNKDNSISLSELRKALGEDKFSDIEFEDLIKTHGCLSSGKKLTLAEFKGLLLKDK